MKQIWLKAIVFGSLSLAACGGTDTTDSRGTLRGAAAVSGARSGTAGTGKGSGYAGHFGSLPQGGAFGVGNIPNAGPLGCTGLQCQQHPCPSGTTTISGRIYDPAGKNPLYNVAAYIPNSMPLPLKSG